jgi:hypothetical protein
MSSGVRERKHNNTRIETLRKTYPSFAEGPMPRWEH